MFPEVFLEYDFETRDLEEIIDKYIDRGLEPPYIVATWEWIYSCRSPLRAVLSGVAHYRSPHDNLTAILGFYRRFSQHTMYTFSGEFRRILKSYMVKQPKQPTFFTNKPLKALKEIFDKTPEELQAIVDRGVYDVS